MLRRLLPLLLLPAAFTACPGEGEGETESTVVVGVQTEDLAGRLTNVHVVAKVDGEVKKDETSPTLPKELEITGRAGGQLEVLVDGQDSGGTRTIVSRRAEAQIPAVKKLLRVQLEQRCLNSAASASGGNDPQPPAITCDAASTCIAGRCVSPLVPFSLLEEYVPNWPATAPDLCRPANAGPPELVLGTGQTDYGPLADGQTLQLEKGPQGGHHIWMAVRMRNMKRSGSRTALTAKMPDDPAATILPAAYVFSFDRDEGTYCKLYGLRFQLDSGAPDLREGYKKFLGKRLEVTVEVADAIGQKTTATKTIKIADKILCPDGTTTTCVAN